MPYDDNGEEASYPLAAPVPDITNVVDDIEGNSHAGANEQLGTALRTALGIGALSMMPNLIADLRNAKDPDARIKFIQMALKEGGYGVKDNKNDHLPTFNFTFVGNTTGSVEISRGATKPQETLEAEDATYPPLSMAQALSALAEAVNGDVDPPAPPPVSAPSVFDLIGN